MGRVLLVILLLTLSLVSCTPREESLEISLPSTPIMDGMSRWGVVNISYLKIARDPSDEQRIVTTLRKGDLVEIESVHYLTERRNVSMWYNIKKDKFSGWVRDEYLDSFPTRDKAETASRIMLEH